MSRHSPTAHYHRFAFDGTVFERVLLAIIEAHTTPANEGRQYERLSMAINALTGDLKAIGQDDATAKALEWMARERQRDACNVDMRALHAGGSIDAHRVRTIPELALLAIHKFPDCAYMVDLRKAAEHLCASFANQHRIGERNCDPAREAMEADAVRRLCAELAEWDVPTRL